MNHETMPAQGPVDANVRQAVTDQLSSAMAAKTDNILREAVTRFLGCDDWMLVDLKGRGTLNRLPSGIEVFCLDGVALVELYPVTVEHEQNGANHVLRATRQHRFLLPNARDNCAAESGRG